MLSTLYSGSVPTVSIDSAKHLISEGAYLLDSREREEYEVSHIANAKWIGYDTFKAERVSDLDTSKTALIYCSVGYRSEKIGDKLYKLGFDEVYNLYGGIFHWKNEGQTVVNMRGYETDSVHAYNRIWSIWLKEGEKVY